MIHHDQLDFTEATKCSFWKIKVDHRDSGIPIVLRNICFHILRCLIIGICYLIYVFRPCRHSFRQIHGDICDGKGKYQILHVGEGLKELECKLLDIESFPFACKIISLNLASNCWYMYCPVFNCLEKTMIPYNCGTNDSKLRLQWQNYMLW